MNRHQPRRGPGDRSSAVGLVVIGLCLAACAAVAVAAAGEPLQDADGAIDRVTLSPWLVVVPIVAVCLLGMLGFTAVRAAGTARRVSKRSAWLTILGFLVLVAALSRLDLDRPTTEDPATFEIAPPVADGGDQSTSWPIWLVVAAGVIAAILLLGRRRRARGARARVRGRSGAGPPGHRRLAGRPGRASASRGRPSSPVTRGCSRGSRGWARGGAGRRRRSSTWHACWGRWACARSRSSV